MALPALALSGNAMSSNKESLFETPALIAPFGAQQLLELMQSNPGNHDFTLDLGISWEEITVEKNQVHFRGLSLSEKQVKKIVKRASVLFAVDEDGPYPIEIRDDTYCKLVPLEDKHGAPTFELSGIKMHRTMGIDPFEDARTKVKAVVQRGDYVFDTCGGMGYTSIWTRRLGATHTTSCELSEDVIALRKYNPYSREYLKDRGIKKLHFSCAEAINDFDDDSLDCIIHDPPRFSLAGELYGEEFLWQMARVLKDGGRLCFYTGDPYRSGRGRKFIDGITKRLRKLHMPGYWVKELQSIVATKE
jgi:predicted methyltransferase